MQPDTGTPSPMNVHLPLTLLAAAAAVFLAAQIGSIDRGTKTLTWQLENTQKQIASLKEAKVANTDALSKAEEQVKQSNQVKEQYSALLKDLMELAKTDPDAKQIVGKWGMQSQATAPAADK